MDQLAQATLGGLAAGLLVGVFLPLRWSLALAAVVTIGYIGVFIAHTPGEHPVIWVAFLFLFVMVPQIIAPAWFGVGVGFGIRTWTENRLALRFAGILAALSLIAGLHHLLQADPKWKQAVKNDAEAFVRKHSDVVGKLGAIKAASPNSTSTRPGDRLPYSQIEYYVRGTKGNALVAVEVSGERNAPAFRVVSIKAAN